MTLRKFIVLLKGLPADSAWQRFLEDKDQYNFATFNLQKMSI